MTCLESYKIYQYSKIAERSLLWCCEVHRFCAFSTCFQCKTGDRSFDTCTCFHVYELRCEETCLRGFQPGQAQTELCSNRRWLEAWYFRFKKWGDCTICVAKTKALISFAVIVKLICVFVFAFAKSRFSHEGAHFDTCTCFHVYELHHEETCFVHMQTRMVQIAVGSNF